MFGLEAAEVGIITLIVLLNALIGVLAYLKGRRLLWYVLASLTISPLPVVLALAVVGRKSQIERKCPACGEMGSIEVFICKQCHHELPDLTDEEQLAISKESLHSQGSIWLHRGLTITILAGTIYALSWIGSIGGIQPN
uniref:Zinc ribbon domain-containing protein n=1 Tax=Magnetococcus massalia (strain MO-1) TaxID=451514 RepID=A0A1S7LHD6_MAGMO|nr:Membrane protein of unknown function [Candidatus Magnetococcus massalia]